MAPSSQLKFVINATTAGAVQFIKVHQVLRNYCGVSTGGHRVCAAPTTYACEASGLKS